MHERTRELLVLIVGDLFFFIVALWLTLLVRYLAWPTNELIATHLGPFLLLSGLWVLVFFIGGLYDKHTVTVRALATARIINTQVVNIMLAALLFFTLPFGITPKTNLVIYLVVSVVLIALWRLLLFPKLQPKTKQRALLLADGPEALELLEEINSNDRYHYYIHRFLDEGTVTKASNIKAKLTTLLAEERISMVIGNPHTPAIEAALPAVFDQAFVHFSVRFFDFQRVYEETFDKVPLSAVGYDWCVSVLAGRHHLLYAALKRVVDVASALCIGVAFIILLPFIYLATKIEGRGPLFIAQKRLGQYGTPVTIYKLRTMTENQSDSSTWTTEDEQGGNEITRVGAVLRKLSIDELPQMWSILRGDMSLIGPRNDIEGLADRLAAEIPYYSVRTAVKPGITGWAQTHQRYKKGQQSPQSVDESRERFSYDLYYVKHRSLLLDVAIALQTVRILFERVRGLFVR